jgi:hypothetical protein
MNEDAMAPNYFRQKVSVDVEGTEVVCDIRYEYTRGRPAYTPRGEYAPIDPPEPPELCILAVLVNGIPAPQWFEIAVENSDKVNDWLIEHHREPEREYERDNS